MAPRNEVCPSTLPQANWKCEVRGQQLGQRCSERLFRKMNIHLPSLSTTLKAYANAEKPRPRNEIPVALSCASLRNQDMYLYAHSCPLLTSYSWVRIYQRSDRHVWGGCMYTRREDRSSTDSCIRVHIQNTGKRAARATDGGVRESFQTRFSPQKQKACLF